MGMGINFMVLTRYWGQNMRESRGDGDRVCGTTVAMLLDFSHICVIFKNSCVCIVDFILLVGLFVLHHVQFQLVLSKITLTCYIVSCCLICKLTCTSHCKCMRRPELGWGWDDSQMDGDWMRMKISCGDGVGMWLTAVSPFNGIHIWFLEYELTNFYQLRSQKVWELSCQSDKKCSRAKITCTYFCFTILMQFVIHFFDAVGWVTEQASGWLKSALAIPILSSLETQLDMSTLGRAAVEYPDTRRVPW